MAPFVVYRNGQAVSDEEVAARRAVNAAQELVRATRDKDPNAFTPALRTLIRELQQLAEGRGGGGQA